MKVTADKATNSLVIVASPNDYETLVGVIKKLDIRRRQVFVEAAILEIDLDKALDLGVEWRGAVEVEQRRRGDHRRHELRLLGEHQQPASPPSPPGTR